MDQKKLQEDYEEIRVKMIMSRFAELEGKIYIEENKELSKEPFYHPSEKTKRNFIHQLKLRFPLYYLKRVIRQPVGNPKVAVILFFLTVALLATTMSVEAVRIRIFNMFIQIKDEYTEIRMGQNPQKSEDNIVSLKGDNAYMPTEIPNGYNLSATTDLKNMKIIQYENDDHDYILFQQNNENSGMNVDSEDADEVIHMTIQGEDGLVIRKNGQTTVIWGDGSRLFSIVGNSSLLSKEALIKMAESVNLHK